MQSSINYIPNSSVYQDLIDDPNLWIFLKQRLNDPYMHNHFIQDLFNMQIACYLRKFPEMVEYNRNYYCKHISSAHQTFIPIDMIDRLVAEKAFWWKAPQNLLAIYQTLLLQDILPQIVNDMFKNCIELIIIEHNNVQKIVKLRDESITDEDFYQNKIKFEIAQSKFDTVLEESIYKFQCLIDEIIKDPILSNAVSHITV